MKNFLCIALLVFMAFGLQAQEKNTQEYVRAYNAYKAGDYATALDIYKTFIEEGYEVETSYGTAISMLTLMDKNEEALNMSTQAMEKFPESEALLMQAINVRVVDPAYYDEAILLLKKAVLIDKENMSVYYMLASLYYDKNMQDEAIPYLDKALSIDSSAYAPNYLYGSIYYSEATELLTKMNNLDIGDARTYDKYKQDMTSLYNKSLPYFLKAHDAEPNDAVVVEVLMKIYMNADDIEKFQEMKSKYDILRGN